MAQLKVNALPPILYTSVKLFFVSLKTILGLTGLYICSLSF